MHTDLDIEPPFFEIGPKAYCWGSELVELARRADALSRALDVRVIITPQYVDIPAVARAVRGVMVFAQHMDALTPGRGVGSVLPEAVKAAGAVGVMLNHVERRLPRPELAETLGRADEVGLATMVCADDVADAVSIAGLSPDVIIVEAPELIAGGVRDESSRDVVAAANAAIWRVDPSIRVLHGAGINSDRDVYDVTAAGAQATGSSSAIFTAPDPAAMLEKMMRSQREAWERTHT
jgi:triosephosphate isomerase (TIM)